MKILYFNAFLCRNGKKTTYPLNQLIQFIMNGKPLERTKKLDNNKVIFLSKKREPNVKRETGHSVPGYEFIGTNRTVWIGKFNDEKPYTGAIGSDDLEQIVGDLYQPNTCLSIADNYLFLMEYNFLGPSKKQIEDFLTSYITNHEEDVKYEIKLFEILKESMLSLIPNSDSIKSVTLKLNNEDFSLGNLFKEMSNEKEKLFQKLIGDPTAAANEMNVNQTTIILQKGRKKKEMDIDQIGEILNMINVNSTELVSAVVEFKNPKTKELEKFDLKHEGYYTGKIDSKTYSAFDILAELMTKHYYDVKGRVMDNYYTKYDLENFVQEEFVLEYPNDNFEKLEQE